MIHLRWYLAVLIFYFGVVSYCQYATSKSPLGPWIKSADSPQYNFKFVKAFPFRAVLVP